VVFAGGDRDQVKLSSNLWTYLYIDLLIMFKHFSSQGHVRKTFFSWITRKTRGEFLWSFSSHNLRTQRTHTIKYFFFFTFFFLSLHFRNQKEMAYAIKIAEWEIRRGNHRFLQIFFLSFFSGYSKKKSATNVCVCIHQNLCGETHERNENENVEKRFFLGYSCVPRNKKKWEKMKRKSWRMFTAHKLRAIVGDSFTNFS